MTKVIGLMSGTSVDGIDAALVEIDGCQFDLQVQLLAAATYPYPAELRSQILAVCGGTALSMAELAALDDAIAQQFAQAALAIQAGVIQAEALDPTESVPVSLIGSHGQTVYHRPPSDSALGYSLQLGRGAAIAAHTGMTTVSNFRVADIAVGGQGAPLVPPVDACLFSHPTQARCVQNLGGIGNLTYLPARESAASTADWWAQIRGWDTGPANALLDLAVQSLSQGQQTYDQNGAWAAQGMPCHDLVKQWLQHPFFQQPPPKSTGRELFGPAYLEGCFATAAAYNLGPADFLATLTELTVASIVHSYQTFLPQLPDQVLLSGGGSRNRYLQQRLQLALPSVQILTTDDMGLNADFKEAIAFAVLAYWRQQGTPSNLPAVTGATQTVSLGEIYLAPAASRDSIGSHQG